MSKLLYRVDEVAATLSFSVSKVYELVKNGELMGHNDSPGHKGLRITVESVIAYFEKHKIPSTFWQE